MVLRPDLYERYAKAWAQQRGDPLLHEAVWLARFTATLKPGAQILDLGCGSGWPIAAELLRAGFVVTGIDASPSLIQSAAESLPNGLWRVGDMRSFDVDHTFSGVIAWHSFFHLSPIEQRAMFPRFSRMCADGGSLIFTSGPEAGVEVGDWMDEPLYHASLDPVEYRALLHDTGFRVIAHAINDPTAGGATVWLARRG